MKQVDTFKRDERGVRKMGAYAKRYSKTDTEPGKAADLEAILDVSIDQIEKRKQGRPPVYPDTDDGLIQFFEDTRKYFEYIKDANSVNEEKLVPDIEGWYSFMGVTKQTILNYERRSPVWEEAIEYIKQNILAAKKQLAFRFKIPPVVYLNDVSNNHGYLNTSEFKLEMSSHIADNEAPALSQEEIRQIAEQTEIQSIEDMIVDLPD